jgi:hypothetical protein
MVSQAQQCHWHISGYSISIIGGDSGVPNISSEDSMSDERPINLYGVSPMMQALPLLKAWNDLPPDVRTKAAAAFVAERLADPNDEWWPLTSSRQTPR